MALLEDKIDQISDPEVRRVILDEVKKLKDNKQFGLVFEHHIPEVVPVYSSPIRPRAMVAKKLGKLNETYRVKRIISGTNAELIKDADGSVETASCDSLVVVKQFGEPIYPALTPINSVQNGDPKSPNHVLIEADNYHALQLLEYLYTGKVDCIYIDPPYNTGARDWKYNNNYVDKADQWRHSKWLSFMHKRLVLAKKLLKPDGVIVVTIDEHEVHHLGVLLEDIFPSYLRHVVSMVINPKGTGKANFARVDEYAIFCVPDIGKSIISGTPNNPSNFQNASEEVVDSESDDERDEGEEVTDVDDVIDIEDIVSDYPFPEEEIDMWELRHARRRGGESSYRHQRKNQFYALYIDPETKRVIRAGGSLLPLETQPTFELVDGLVPVWPIDAEGNHRCWRFIPTKMQSLIDERRVVLGKFNQLRQTWTINIWERKPDSRKLKTVWWESIHDAGTHGTMLLHKILGRRDAFPFPKSVYAVKDTLAAVVRDRPDALIVDFFAGSGTTFHAVSLLNYMDGGRRQCISVTNNEVQEKKAEQLKHQGKNPGDIEWEKHGICQSATFPRSKYVLNGKRDDGTVLSGEYITGRKIKEEVSRTVRPLGFTGLDQLNKVSVRKQLAAAMGVKQSKIDSGPWYLLDDDQTSILFDLDKLDDFCSLLQEQGKHLTTIYLLLPNNQAFKVAKERILSALPPLFKEKDETLPFSTGFEENLQYFRLDFLDPEEIVLGLQFEAILPVLWMTAGSIGTIPTTSGSEPYIVPEDCPFAVLLQEHKFREFVTRVKDRSDITHVFLVTNSEEAFYEMKADLNVPNIVMLYKNYLKNFEINKQWKD